MVVVQNSISLVYIFTNQKDLGIFFLLQDNFLRCSDGRDPFPPGNPKLYSGQKSEPPFVLFNGFDFLSYKKCTALLLHNLTAEQLSFLPQLTRFPCAIFSDASILAFLALYQVLKQIQFRYASQPGVNFAIYSDCQMLVSAVNRNCIDDLPIWRVAHIVAECATLLTNCGGFTTVLKAAREVVQEAHQLANWARRTGQSFQGVNEEVTTLNFTLQTRIIECRF